MRGVESILENDRDTSKMGDGRAPLAFVGMDFGGGVSRELWVGYRDRGTSLLWEQEWRGKGDNIGIEEY